MKCLTCKYMAEWGSSQKPDGEYITREGSCHRYPPVAAPRNTRICPIEDMHYWLFPIVDLMDFSPDWCGEYQEKDNEY